MINPVRNTKLTGFAKRITMKPKTNQISNGVKKFLFFTIISIILFSPLFSQGQDILGQETIFNIESSYDLSQRSQLSATLIKISPSAYWYMDKDFWHGLSYDSGGQGEIERSLNALAQEFEESIYPKLTQTFGFEWSPGIDKDTRITVLMHPMKKESGGYFDSSDEYPKVQLPESNEREMIYLNTSHINTDYAKSFLAHEFIHLITFNQKNKIYNISEDTWLNEARAEYAPTLLGYDKAYEGSNLQRRIKDFLDKPSDSLTEWRDSSADYGIINLFIQYLVDHYGVDILVDSLKTAKTGIESLNVVLAQRGFKEDFSQVFANWTIAVLVNDCQFLEKYCYFNQNLKNLRIVPLTNYLPFVGESTLLVNNTTKDWSSNWHKFIGGSGTLRLEFKMGNEAVNFKVPYMIQDSQGNFSVNTLTLKNNQGEILVSDFGSKNISLIIMPIAQGKTSNFSGLQPFRSFSWSASTWGQKEEEIDISIPPLSKPISQMTRAEILARITELQNLVGQLQNLLGKLSGVSVSCKNITENLFFGMLNNSRVSCLQEFLKSQGLDIYPEGIVSGNFGKLTQIAVVRFQEKYAAEILAPLGLKSGTGIVGASTRAKINQLLTK